MKRRRKRDFTRTITDDGEWFDTWVDNLVSPDTRLSMGYSNGQPEVVFWSGYVYRVGHLFEGETG